MSAEVKILLPQFLGSRSPEALFSLCTQIRESTGDIVLDASELQFVDPLGFAVTAAVLSDQRDRRIRMPWLSVDLARYMARMDFFEQVDVDDLEIGPARRANLEASLVELTCLSDSTQVDTVAARLATAITGNLTKASPDEPIDFTSGTNTFYKFQRPLQYALTELLENALTHARRHGRPTASVWVTAQYYPSRSIVRFAVVDNGCGMLRSLEKHSQLVEHSHLGAIKTALLPRVSCNRDGKAYEEHGNQGVGLTTTSRIATAARGHIAISTGDAYYSTRGTSDTRAPMASGAFWDGVAITFECERSKLPSIKIPDLLPEVVADDTVINFS